MAGGVVFGERETGGDALFGHAHLLGLLHGAPGATSMQAYWTLADADDPAAAAWIARPANGGARVTNGGRPHDLMLFAVHGNATRNNSSASTIRASKRVGRGQGALLAEGPLPLEEA